jgi:uncharacterized lipoprotein NlpE involved in copper resistance
MIIKKDSKMKKTLLAISTLSFILMGCDSAEKTAEIEPQILDTEQQETRLDLSEPDAQTEQLTEAVVAQTNTAANTVANIDADVNAIAEASKAMIKSDESGEHWQGTYSGTMPCADCDGVDTVLTLNQDETYQLTETYIGKANGVIKSTGAVQWDETGTMVTLVNDNGAQPVKYQLDNEFLTKLDVNGTPLTGDFASLYHLTKQN